MTQGGVAKMPQNKNEQQLIGEALYKTMKEAQKASIEFAKAFKQENIMKTKDGRRIDEHRFIIENYTWKKVVRKIIKIYKETLEK